MKKDWKLTEFSVESEPFGSSEVTLEDDVTVFFGWNAAGKTWLLERIVEAMSRGGGAESTSTSMMFSNGTTTATYERARDDDGCVTRFTESDNMIWHQAAGVATVEGGAVHIGEHLALIDSKVSLGEAEWIREFAHGIVFIGPGIGQRRNRSRSSSSFLQRSDDDSPWKPFAPAAGEAGIVGVACRLANWQIEKPHSFSELTDVLKRVDIDLRFAVAQVSIPDADGTITQYGVPHGCGVRFHLLSDGTLKTIKICMELVSGRTKLLMFDEPENSLHPGRIDVLLNEIETYGRGKQVLICTHSPQVVGWARPKQLRLVEMGDDGPTFRPLSAGEASDAESYLRHNGTLGEWVFGAMEHGVDSRLRSLLDSLK